MRVVYFAALAVLIFAELELRARPIATGCGNGIIDPGEQCDDGNMINGDGCSAGCFLEGPDGSVYDGGEDAGAIDDSGVDDSGAIEDSGVVVDSGGSGGVDSGGSGGVDSGGSGGADSGGSGGADSGASGGADSSASGGADSGVAGGEPLDEDTCACAQAAADHDSGDWQLSALFALIVLLRGLSKRSRTS